VSTSLSCFILTRLLCSLHASAQPSLIAHITCEVPLFLRYFFNEGQLKLIKISLIKSRNQSNHSSQWQRTQTMNQSKLEVITCSWRVGKRVRPSHVLFARVSLNIPWLLTLLRCAVLIGWKSGASFWRQSCGVVMQNQSLFDTQVKTSFAWNNRYLFCQEVLIIINTSCTHGNYTLFTTKLFMRYITGMEINLNIMIAIGFFISWHCNSIHYERKGLTRWTDDRYTS